MGDDEKDGKKRPKDFNRKSWAPPNGNEDTCDDEYVSSAASGSDDDSDPPISIQGGDDTPRDSADEGYHGKARVGAADPNVSIGASVSDDDIMNESDDEED